MKALLLFSSLFVTLSFVPFAFSSSSPAVVDVDGKEVKCGVPYYAFSSAFILRAGLCLVDVKNQTIGCPYDVVQCSILHKPILGLPIIFKSVNATKDAVVREGTPYLIRFPVTGLSCVKDIVWRLKDAHTFWKFVTTDPATTPAAQFQIQRDGFGYKIAYCVAIPLPSTTICYGIGFIQDGVNRRLGVGLGVNSVPFLFTRNATAVDKLATS